MGRFSALRDKLADKRDSLTIKFLEAQLEKDQKKQANFEKDKEKFLAQTAKLAHKSGQPATVFEQGKWYIFYPDGKKEPIGGDSSNSMVPPSYDAGQNASEKI